MTRQSFAPLRSTLLATGAAALLGTGALLVGATTSGAAITQLTKHLTGMTFSAAHRGALQTFLDEPAGTPLVNSSLRWNGYPLAALVLDAPHHALR